MRSKIVLISASVLLTAGIGFHVAGYCPLQHLHEHSVKQTPAVAQPALPEAKVSLVKAK